MTEPDPPDDNLAAALGAEPPFEVTLGDTVYPITPLVLGQIPKAQQWLRGCTWEWDAANETLVLDSALAGESGEHLLAFMVLASGIDHGTLEALPYAEFYPLFDAIVRANPLFFGQLVNRVRRAQPAENPRPRPTGSV